VLDIGCGTGIAHARLREAGYQPVGIDLAFDQLRIASGRLPVAQADAARLPIPDGVVPAAFSTFVASDLDDFESAAAEVYRVLEPGGRYVAVCIHPCFDGNHAERRADGNVLQLTGYRVTSFAPASHFSTPVRGAVGAWHRPLADQINLYLRLGFVLREVREDGTEPIPNQLALLLQKPDERNAA
jgi:SAM-dependent methyltransferase